MGGIKNKVKEHVARCKREIRTASYWRDVFCETLATFFLMSVQCSVALTWGRPEVSGSSLTCTLAMSCVVTILVEVFSPLGGAHMNPAVSIAFVISGNTTVLKALIYIVMQCLAAVAGAAFMFWLTPAEFRGTLAATEVHPMLTVGQGLVTEIWVTSLLVFTIHGSSNEGRRPVYMNAVIIGMAVAVGSASGGDFSGASMNPARSFGPAVVMGIWENHWIYWAGPIMGAVLATVSYVYIFDKIGHPAEINNNKLSEPLDHKVDEGQQLSAAPFANGGLSAPVSNSSAPHWCIMPNLWECINSIMVHDCRTGDAVSVADAYKMEIHKKCYENEGFSPASVDSRYSSHM